jgi:predicted transglutaminase-like protease
MKRFILAFIIILMGIPAWFAYGSVPDLETLVNDYPTMQKLSVWIESNIWYTREPKGQDNWQSAEETFKLKKGDCEDFAILAMYVLDKKGYQTYLLSVWNDLEGHAVLVISFNNDYYVMNNGHLTRTWATHLAEVPKEIGYGKKYDRYHYFTKEYISLRTQGLTNQDILRRIK